MNVHDTVKRMIEAYPSLFANRTQALHQLFAVNGSGYEWKDGELVTLFPDTKEELSRRFDQTFLSAAASYETRLYWRLRDEREVERLQGIRDHAEVLADISGPGLQLYPYCAYAQIVNLPDPVQKDWKEAAVEHAWEIDSLMYHQIRVPPGGYDASKMMQEWHDALIERGLLI